MQPEIIYGSWWRVESDNGTDFHPANIISRSEMRSNYNGKVSIRTVKGWGARLSMPGYLDSTDWTVFKTEQEARDFLIEFYDVDPNDL